MQWICYLMGKCGVNKMNVESKESLVCLSKVKE